jgi:flavin reductase (DIM6/NTAB) family NADH-FMN oxidoreductase RutF
VTDTSDPTIDESRFRQVLGHFPSGVTVITARGEDGTPAGLAVGSFASLSLDPPLVLFCAAKASSTWPKIEAAGSFCVNILAEDQETLCRQFASKTPDKFAGVGWKPGQSGAPILNDVLGWIDCRIESVLDGGDHHIVVGRVLELESSQGRPLVFYRGGYGRFEA